MIAVASPLPATIPGTLIALVPYSRAGAVDRRLVRVTLISGFPATILGAIATRWVDGNHLVTVTEFILIGLGIRFAIKPHRDEDDDNPSGPASTSRILAVGAVVGIISGLLANSGGFLLAPLFMLIARVPLRVAFAASLAASAVLAIPGTIVHAALGHIDWQLVAIFSATSVPLSYIGAKTSLRIKTGPLERIYGVALATIGIVLLMR